MAYNKFLLDNVACNRRFHVSFDDEEELTRKKDHPPLKVIRDEIVIKTTKLSSRRSKECKGRDFFPPKEV